MSVQLSLADRTIHADPVVGTLTCYGGLVFSMI